MAGGLFPPDAPTITNSRDGFVAKKFATSVEGYGNAWIDFWRRGLQQNPQTKFALMKPFAAHDGGKAQVFLSPGFLSMNALKKAEPERIKELLRILNYLAAPFGSEEDLLLTAGIKGQDYTVDDKGNPQPNQQGIANARYVPWQYITQRPYVNYQADIPGFAKGAPRGPADHHPGWPRRPDPGLPLPDGGRQGRRRDDDLVGRRSATSSSGASRCRTSTRPSRSGRATSATRSARSTRTPWPAAKP